MKSGILNELHQQRWDAARRLFQGMIDVASREKAKIMFDQTVIEPEQIVISDDGIHVKFPAPSKPARGAATYIMFEPNVERDHGLYTPMANFAADMTARFTVVKTLKW
jgi:hypothetical protein